ncbi:Inclusion body protein [Paraburkholderia fungorum]|uniref:Inclusion body protein n=1 Tax=Paraburkholderia fungorum TaxID=134537 RepID=A0A1H1H921_9BURK|nr:inclusion body family protein [Paraburkholderia fungorum]SDR21869.1 Inclusion body protein [Paraburkholderia fungorum]
MTDNVLGPRVHEINVLVVIDTEYLKSTYPNPSKDHNNPTAIDHARQYMLCTGSRGIVSGQGSGDLEFKANPGDNITFTGVSIYNNSDDAVIVYDLKHFCGQQVFTPFYADMVVRTGAVQPNADSPNRNGLPPVKKPTNFAVFDSKIRTNGREGLGLAFGLYTLAANGQNQELYGYFWWDPTITITG